MAFLQGAYKAGRGAEAKRLSNQGKVCSMLALQQLWFTGLALKFVPMLRRLSS